jgi:hypothetical protein
MSQIPMCGLFLTCKEESLLFCTHIRNEVGVYLLKESILLGKVIPCSWQQIPYPLSPLLEVNCPCVAYISLTPTPASLQQSIYFT